ncbi:MAG TPA: class I SAM-dependent methyltransferase [Solirubrobacteraceae bacterium]|jgi:SAM-dependent methyltransferase|nr:class I SAM-dependent methyltransferase [Solirubrobacteraceae bacterium]
MGVSLSSDEVTCGAGKSHRLEPQTADERYFLDYVMRQRERYGEAMTVLDFGCGLGQKVRLLRQAGVKCVGAEVFYEGSAWEDAELDELVDAGVIVRIAPDGRLPFDEGSFDVIVSDEVIEHVEDLDRVAAELNRVLRNGGRMYHQFPTVEILREVHIGIPFAHRLPPNALRFAYVLILRSAGLGSYKHEVRGRRAWTAAKLAWIDQYCHYRPLRQVERILGSGRRVRHDEADYLRARAQAMPVLGRLLGWRRLDWILARSFRLVGSTALEIE